LDEYLRHDGHVGCLRLASLAIGFTIFFLMLAALGFGFQLISIGALGIVATILAVSTLAYRRLVFTNLNPEWNEAIQGTISPEGIRVVRSDSNTFYRWSWYGEAASSASVVALIPATQSGTPLLITREMLPTVEAWQAIKSAAGRIVSDTSEREASYVRRDQNVQVLKDRQREWSLNPPAEAICFEGIVWSDDLALVYPRTSRHLRPLRTHIVTGSLFVFAGLILAGCSGLLFDNPLFFVPLVVTYVVATVIIGRKRYRASREVIYYLRGCASQSSVITDVGLAVSETNWPGLTLLLNRDHALVLQRKRIGNLIVIRRDMLADESAWMQLRELVQSNCGAEG
jgi:hypothetical protein